MGNRAVITFDMDLGTIDTNTGKYYKDGVELQDRPDKIGIYLHWNGGYDSINAFCKYCKMRGFRGPVTDDYGIARLVQIAANFVGSSLSIGINTLNRLDCDNYDNGVYIVNDGWEIVGRQYFEGREQNEYELKEMLEAINKAQPEKQQLSKEDFEAEYQKL